jgi:hypothetical protein
MDQSDDDIDKYNDDDWGEDSENEDDFDEEPDDGNGGPADGGSSDWYHKVKYLLDHVVSTSKKMCPLPSTRLSIDEMLTRFKGRSTETFRMKAKPIKQGYKFWALCDTSGYVFSIVPCGRTQGDDSEEKEIAPMVKSMAEWLPRRVERDYIITMDNLFTTGKVMSGLRDLNVGACGTARVRRGWPPTEIKSVDDDTFNTVYYYATWP